MARSTTSRDFSPETVSALRVHSIGGGGSANPAGRYVLYWSQIFRRPEHNHALNYAVERANDLALPVVVYEGLRHDYPWASDRIHAFILEGARQSARAFAQRGIPHLFFLERHARERRKVVEHLARDAALVVTDLFPSFIIPGQTRKAASRIAVPLLAVDSCGVFPLELFGKEEYAARTFRPKVLRLLGEYLAPFRDPVPEHQRKDPGIEFPWALDLEAKPPTEWVAECAIDHSVPPVPGIRGGHIAAKAALERFVERKLASYADERSHPDADAGSGLSPYLHFGHISAIDVALAVNTASAPSRSKEAFLEELIVRRELSYNFAWRNPEHESLRGLPSWALENLARHDVDPRASVYGLEAFERAETHDEVWNAAQRQLLREGRIHNYMRMLWGKKVIEWSGSHAEAFRILVHLNNKYGLDGRDPNSWTGILWCFGKHDRPWQKTPVLGTARPMSTDRARKKLRMEAYLERFGR